MAQDTMTLQRVIKTAKPSLVPSIIDICSFSIQTGRLLNSSSTLNSKQKKKTDKWTLNLACIRTKLDIAILSTTFDCLDINLYNFHFTINHLSIRVLLVAATFDVTLSLAHYQPFILYYLIQKLTIILIR